MEKDKKKPKRRGGRQPSGGRKARVFGELAVLVGRARERYPDLRDNPDGLSGAADILIREAIVARRRRKGDVK